MKKERHSLRAFTAGLLKLTGRARGPLTGQEREVKSSKKFTQPDPLYLSYMSGLSANPHIHLKYGEDMRARGRARTFRRVGRGPTPDHIFSFFIHLFCLSLHLHQSCASDRTYEEENKNYGCVDG